MSISSCLGSTKWQVDFSANSGRVDVANSGVHLIHCMEGSVDIACVDGGGQTVPDSIGDLDGVLQRVGGNDGGNWSKDLFLGDTHVRGDVGENGRLDEIAIRIIATSQALTPAG